MKAMVAIRILEMTMNGLMVIIELPTVEPLFEKEKQQQAIDAIVDLAYNNDKMYLSMEDRGFVIQGLKNKTIVVQGVMESKWRIEEDEK